MNKCDVVQMFYNQEHVRFGKGFDVFEETYEELKDRLHLKRKEIDHVGWVEVDITKEDTNE